LVTLAKKRLHSGVAGDSEPAATSAVLLAAMSLPGWSHRPILLPYWCHRAELLISTRRVPFVVISNPRPNFLDLAFPMAVSPGN